MQTSARGRATAEIGCGRASRELRCRHNGSKEAVRSATEPASREDVDPTASDVVTTWITDARTRHREGICRSV